MAAPIRLRSDFSAADLRQLARRSRTGAQARRLLTLAAIYDGASRSEAAVIGDVTLQIIRDWVLRFNAEGPGGLIDRKPSGAPSKLSADQRRALVAAIETGPIPAAHGVVRWRQIDLVQWIWEEFRISLSTTTLSQALGAPAPPCSTRRGGRQFQKKLPRARSGRSMRAIWERSMLN